jgi:hypothetical protein
MSPGEGADWAITSLPGLTFDYIVVFQHRKHKKTTKNSHGGGANWAITPLPGLQNELRSLPESRFAHSENYYCQGPKIQHKIDF